MIAEIRRLLDMVPFRPFTIVTSSGKHYHVPSSDHAGFNPGKTRVVIWFDDDSHIDIAALHIVALERMAPAATEVP